jgi:hypothetical protein
MELVTAQHMHTDWSLDLGHNVFTHVSRSDKSSYGVTSTAAIEADTPDAALAIANMSGGSLGRYVLRCPFTIRFHDTCVIVLLLNGTLPPGLSTPTFQGRGPTRQWTHFADVVRGGCMSTLRYDAAVGNWRCNRSATHAVATTHAEFCCF